MKRVLIIPDIKNPQEALSLAEQYDMGFEYNDFFDPVVLDDAQKLDDILETYAQLQLPRYCTLHGAFLDVIPFSRDRRIREVSAYRIGQSIEIARKIGAPAVVFHTNYNPFLNTSAYIQEWIDSNAMFWGEVLQQNPDINIYLENMFDRSPNMLKALSERLCSYENYGVCLDYSHAVISETVPEVWVRSLGRFVKHVHINDNDLVSDLHLAWGDGKVDRQQFYRLYEEYMQDATVLIETSTAKNRLRSVELLASEGFLEKRCKG